MQQKFVNGKIVKMFSQLCRACLSYLNPGDFISLFTVEPRHNVFYYHMCNQLQLLVEENDELPQNVCKSCAKEISRIYKFHLMYIGSDRELRQMLAQTIDPNNDMVDPELNIEEAGSIVQTTLGETLDSRWKCDKCSASFSKRSLLNEHVKEFHRRSNKIEQHYLTDHQNSALMEPTEVPGLYENEYFDDSYTDNGNDYDIHDSNVIEIDGNWTNETAFECIKLEPMTDHDDSNSELSLLVERDDNNFNGQLVNDIGILGYQSQGDETYEKWKCKKCSKYFRTRKLLREHNRLHRESNQEFKIEIPKTEHVRIKDIPKAKQVRTENIPKAKQVKTENVPKTKQVKDTDAVASISEMKPSLDDFGQFNQTYRWKCKTCWGTFKTRDLLRAHRRTHWDPIQLTDLPGRQCTFCSMTFKSRKECRAHRKNEHPHARKVKEELNGTDCLCSICDKTFSSIPKLRKHMETHKDKEPKRRLCNICGLKLSSTSGLNKHIRTFHNGEKRFKCTLCESQFSHGIHLQAHMNRHKDIKPFACELCNKSFYGKNSLRTHQRSIHLNFKSFACEICSKAFNRNDNLKAHLRRVHHYQL